MLKSSKIIAITACDEQYGIGLKGQIPWHNTADFKFFKQKTYGKTVIMGRKTMESLPKKSLFHRLNLVLSKKDEFEFESYSIKCGETHPLTYGPFGFSLIHNAISFATDYFNDYIHPIYIIGGRQIYDLAFKEDIIDELHITNIDSDYKCDTFFPIHHIENWQKEKLDVEGLNVDCYKKVHD